MGRPTNERASFAKPKSGPGADSYDGMQQLIAVNDASRTVILHGEVNESSICSVIVQLLALANHSPSPIHLVVSTYGGSVDEMFSLYDVIKFLPCPVHTVALGKVMSAGVLLLASGVKGKRLIGKSSRIMIHPVSAGAQGNVFEMLNETKELQRLQQLMVESLVAETKMSKEKAEEIMASGKDCYLTPTEAIELGIVDRVI